MNEKKTPRIRFKGFTDDWEQRKLGEVVTYKNGKGHEDNQSDEGTYELVNLNSISIDGGLKPSGKFIEDGSDTLLENDLVMVLSDVGHGDLLGRVAIIPENNRFVLNQRVALLRINDNTNPYFLFSIINRHQDYFKKLGAGSSQLNISRGTVEEFIVDCPCHEEQEKIANHFQTLDNLITLHQRKYEKLQIIKKSMLENCFPKNGEKVPKIRFSGFTGDWEQRKVGEVIEDYVEKTTVQNQYPVLTSSQQQGIVLQEDYFADRQVTTNDNVGYYVLPRGYFTYRSRSDTDLFVFNRNNLIDKGIISYYYPVFRPKNADSNFLLRRLNNGIRSQVSMAAEGTGQHVLAHSKLKNMEFLVPSVPEQKLIGAYFEILDNLITLHQSELEKLQKIKKSLLERMFV
jgi:type I restriction enzyme S subunit